MSGKGKTPGRLALNGFEFIGEEGTTGLVRARMNLGGLTGNVSDMGDFRLEVTDAEKADVDPEEFLLIKGRMLSKAITQSRYFDFTRDDVLKKAVPLFDKRTVYADHWASVDDWKGYVSKPVWDEENKPAGINALVTLDRLTDPRLCRGFDIGALRSFSATLTFAYEKSHPDIHYYGDYIGKEIDGQLVRIIVTEIRNVFEVSVVWEGEDPYAKKLTHQLTRGKEKEKEMLITLTKALQDALCIQENQVELSVLEKAVDDRTKALGAEIEKLSAEKAALESDAATGKQYLADMREKALAAYQAVKGEQFSQVYVEHVIKPASLETAKAILDEYVDKLESSMPLNCPKCGAKMSRQSSQATDPDKGNLLKMDKRDFKV